MRIAVASDIHAYDPAVEKESSPSHLNISESASLPTRHPIAGLKKLIADLDLKADILICPGDMADKASTSALTYVWNELHSLKSLLGADRLIATAGNHDVDSRHKYNNFDAKGALQSLLPQFPGLSEQECDRYWARNFVLIEEERWRILLLNSSAYHGGGKDQAKEAGQGRISESTLSAIESALTKSDKRDLNILVCHHHLFRDNAIHESDYSEMDGADHLLRLLGSATHGQWVVVHGHKHHPKLQYGAGGSASPVIFGAGSLCASLYAELAARARNQFYIVDLDPMAASRHSLDVAGKIHAWDWIPNSGWKPAGMRSGLPHLSGFGYRATISAIASRIVGLFSTSDPFLRWSELVSNLPEIEYLLHTDVDAVLQHLKATHLIGATQSDRGAVVELARI
jgi:predicted phosphodiesterase